MIECIELKWEGLVWLTNLCLYSVKMTTPRRTNGETNSLEGERNDEKAHIVHAQAAQTQRESDVVRELRATANYINDINCVINF